MKDGEDRPPAIREVSVACKAEASRLSEGTDLPLSQLRTDLQLEQLPAQCSPEQRAALVRIKEALGIHAAFFYPPDPR